MMIYLACALAVVLVYFLTYIDLKSKKRKIDEQRAKEKTLFEALTEINRTLICINNQCNKL